MGTTKSSQLILRKKNTTSAPRPTVAKRALTYVRGLENDTALRLECDVYRPPEAIKRTNKDVFLLLHAHGKLGGSRFMLNSYAILLAMRGFITYNISFRGCDGNEKTSRASLIRGGGRERRAGDGERDSNARIC